MPVCACICVHDDFEFLADTLTAAGSVPRYVFVSRVNWNGGAGCWEESQRIAESSGAIVVVGDWTSEWNHRHAAYEEVREAGFTHAIILDSDEIIESALLAQLVKIADDELADRVYVEWDTYWKSVEYVIRPRERFTPCMMIDLRMAHNTRLREFEGGRSLFLNESYGIVHHLSYAGTDERIRKKTTTWSHRDEVRPGWFQQVWAGWDADRTMRNLHPTHPDAYGFAERIKPPKCLQSNTDRTVKSSSPQEDILSDWPRVSVVIPLHGGCEDIRLCLESLDALKHLLHEVIVVDNASPDGADETAASFGMVTMVRHDSNEGFSRACNKGFAASTGEIILFLNSDAVIPKVSLVPLIESLLSSGTIGASAPYTNWACNRQRIDPTYTELSTLELFAEDFAKSTSGDHATDMLIGFCLAIRRCTLEEVGSFDERFGLGSFEDSDLCYRLRRSGYKLLICARSYVHHHGSKTFQRISTPAHVLLERNERLYRHKWREDLQSGFASHLSGLDYRGPIVFEPERSPDLRRKRAQQDAELARISLCMIVRNEEKVIEDCLHSAAPFFSQMLVVDTGSTDRTIEIAASQGATVASMEWPDSFALARAKSMEGATGRWIMWMDADDTLPIHCGEEILQAVRQAPDDVVGFVVPVRFVEEQGHGTQVDHVKVFRNLPGLEWEGRIHEQILPSLRRAAVKAGIPDGGRLVRLSAYVLHSGYDTSEEGQARKRRRDEHLLKLDLEDRPDHPFVLFNLGMTAHYTGDHEAAAGWLRKSLEKSDPSESQVRKAYALLGASLRHLGKTEEAKTALTTAQKLIPDDPEILFHLAQLAADEGDPKQATQLYWAVLRADVSGVFTSLDPGILGFKARNNLALAYMELGDYASAKEQWEAAIRESPRTELVMSLFNVAVERSDLETTRRLLRLIREREGYSDVWCEMTVKLSEITGLDPCAHFMAVLNQDEANVAVRKALAMRLLNTAQLDAAVAQFRILQSNDVPEGAFFLGVLAEEDGQPAKALAWYKRALELNPGHVETSNRVERLGGQGPKGHRVG